MLVGAPALGNTITGSGTNGLSELTFDTANATGQFGNNTLTGNAANDLVLTNNGLLFQAKAVNNAAGGFINITNPGGIFQIDGNPVTLNPGAAVTVGPGVTTGQNNFPSFP